MKLFSLKDVTLITNNENTAKSMLSAGIRNGTICRIKTNLYAVTDLATLKCAVNKYEIASHITENACLAYHSAMEYHGLGHQIFNEVSVMAEASFRTFEFEGMTYIRRQPTITDGIEQPLMNAMVRVTDLERTVIDCIDRIKYAGGIEELLNNLSAISYLDEGKLQHYLEEYGKAYLYQKTGFLLSLLKNQMHISAGFFRFCKANIGRSTRYLTDSLDPSIYEADWRLCFPANLSVLYGKGEVDV